jgi:3-hydroxyacyl-[acyl-carrier-protein] dehydratase
MRFYLVDRILEACPGKYVEGIKCISMSDDVFNEHFPGYPVFPGSLILEGLAQMTGLFLQFSLHGQGLPEQLPALSMVKSMKYRRKVIPGDVLSYRAELNLFYPGEYAAASVTASCEGRRCAEGELFFGFLDMDEQLKKASHQLMHLAFKNTRIIS